MKRILVSTVLSVLVFILLCPAVFAAESTEAVAQPVKLNITGSGYSGFNFLKDGYVDTYYTSADSCSLKLTAEEAFGSLYLMFDLEYGEYTITDDLTGQSQVAGKHSMLHEYVELTQPTTSVTLSFSSGKVRLSEISAYTPGTAPEGVQVWDAPLDGKTDLLLLSTHGDDDQLFFAGLLPLYAAERGYAVQVAYLTDHRNLTNQRTHEMLNGLWAVGVKAYPVFGEFADFRIDDLNATYNRYAQLGTTKDDLLGYVVGLMRRFKPQVVVSHDFKGEYGHGMHMAYTDLMVQALDIVNDETKFPEIATQYGTWDVPKAYVHLYDENPVTIDYDTPLESFDGMTAFEVSQKLGYPCHKSQQYTWFTNWINGNTVKITTAAEILTYNPCKFGLYRSTVGQDVKKDDFMENIVSYAEQARLEAERLEAERLEAERLEAERIEKEKQEEAARLEAERLAAEEKAKQDAALQESERATEAMQAKRAADVRNAIILCVVTVVLVCAVAIILISRSRARKRNRHFDD